MQQLGFTCDGPGELLVSVPKNIYMFIAISFFITLIQRQMKVIPPPQMFSHFIDLREDWFRKVNKDSKQGPAEIGR
jgi:hypothetical protein